MAAVEAARTRYKGSVDALATVLQLRMPVPSFLAYTESLTGPKAPLCMLMFCYYHCSNLRTTAMSSAITLPMYVPMHRQYD